MKLIHTVTGMIALAITACAQAAPGDTVLITPAHIKTSRLKEGTSRYLVYFKTGKDAPRSNTNFWTRTVQRSTSNNQPAITVTQVWEDKDSIMHTTTSMADAVSFQTLYHKSWWKQRGSTEFDFMNRMASMNGVALSDADTAAGKKRVWDAYKKAWEGFTLNWHLDLEVFPLLPYRKGVTFLVPYYDPGATPPQQVAYTVAGTAELTGYNNQKIDCWLLTHETKGNKEVFWISKKTYEVLKLEQEVTTPKGVMYRYKIKLGFSV